MAPIDFTSAFARLLCDAALREAFARDPVETSARLGVDEPGRSSFLALNPADLEAQANALLEKRFHEVSRLIPDTMTRLGSGARERFGAFAKISWPTGHQRHLIDALRFLESLDAEVASDAERHWLTFALGRRRLAIHALPAQQNRKPFQFLVRTGRGVRAWRIEIGF